MHRASMNIFLNSRENIQMETKNNLTRREKEILNMIYRGYNYQEIADSAFISINTVNSHIRNILQKLKVNNRTQALVKAINMGVVCQR
jgi:DNA-binding CsgD family transcriptional regulator